MKFETSLPNATGFIVQASQRKHGSILNPRGQHQRDHGGYGDRRSHGHFLIDPRQHPKPEEQVGRRDRYCELLLPLGFRIHVRAVFAQRLRSDTTGRSPGVVCSALVRLFFYGHRIPRVSKPILEPFFLP
jgi:hypothetical protein